MRIETRTHWLPKRGNTEAEYEDAFYPLEPFEGFAQCFRSAVSDGASESILSGPWAEVLVKTFCQSEVPVSKASFRAIIGRACMAHEEWMREYLQRREREGRPVQWFEEPGLEAGAFATVLGICLQSPPTGPGAAGGKWEAVALGDSCLFQVRGGELAAAFPIKRSSGFSQRPLLVASNPVRNKLAMGKLRVATGTWRRGDRFYLMTDALSAWFLKELEQGGEPWAALDGAVTGPSVGGGRGQPELQGISDIEFASFVEGLRAGGQMRNDDVTMTRIRVV